MEDTLGGRVLSLLPREETVLILVLMEDTLGVNHILSHPEAVTVLILVLMEDTLGVGIRRLGKIDYLWS